MNTQQACNQWYDFNRAAMEPFLRWNEVAFQSVERLAGNRGMINQWFEVNRSAFDPVLRWNEIALRAAEQVARHNLTLAQDYLDLGSRHFGLLCDVKDPQKWKDEEGKLVSEFGQKIVDHAGDYLKVAQETRDALNNLASDAARHLAETTHRATETTAKATSEAAAPPRTGAQAQAQAAQQQAHKV